MKKIKKLLFTLVLVFLVVLSYDSGSLLITLLALFDNLLLYIGSNILIITSALGFAVLLIFSPVCRVVGVCIFPLKKEVDKTPKKRQIIHSPDRSLTDMYFEQRVRKPISID